MISRIVIKDPSQACPTWWNKVPFLQGKTEIKFGPGMNVLFGPNGSGKTTVLLNLARTLFAHQGGISVFTQNGLWEMNGSFSHENKPKSGWSDGVLPEHDGQQIRAFFPEHKVGLYGGMAAFDDDFFAEGVSNCMAKISSGQDIVSRLMRVIEKNILDHIPSKYSAEKLTGLAKFLKGSIPKGPPTVLLDEPDRSLDYPNQVVLWHGILRHKGVQFIVTTHNPLALTVPGAVVIETQPGYVDKVRGIALDPQGYADWAWDEARAAADAKAQEAKAKAPKPKKRATKGPRCPKPVEPV